MVPFLFSVLLYGNLDDWGDRHFEGGYKFQGFWNPHNTASALDSETFVPCIESSCIYCTPQYPMIVELCNELLKIQPSTKASVNAYIDRKAAENDAVEQSGANMFLDYHIAFHMLTKIIRKNKGISKTNPWSNGIYLLNTYSSRFFVFRDHLVLSIFEYFKHNSVVGRVNSLDPKYKIRKIINRESKAIDEEAKNTNHRNLCHALTGTEAV